LVLYIKTQKTLNYQNKIEVVLPLILTNRSTPEFKLKLEERLKFTANYDTQSTFDFQNLIKVEFIPPSLSDVKYGEDGIIQGIEAGNISMPIKNSLINGAQSLFGLKTKLQFGKTNITAVFSQQNSESKTVTAEGGASIQEFELRATDYDNDQALFFITIF